MKKKIVISLVLLVAITICIINIGKVEAEESNEKYSIDYLLRNYNAVTFGTKDNNIPSEYKGLFSNIQKGDIKNANIEGPVLAKGEYANKENNNVNYDELYSQVMNESQSLVEQTEININNESMLITKPGIYTINNTTNEYYSYNGYRCPNYSSSYQIMDEAFKGIRIDNYDPNNYYVFNILNTHVVDNYRILIKKTEDPSFQLLEDYIKNNDYNGNIIFNYPNAKFMVLSFLNGNIIAPQADVYLVQLQNYSTYGIYFNYNIGSTPSTDNVYGSILANSIKREGNNLIHFTPIKIDKSLISKNGEKYINEINDYNDDLYHGDYSLSSLLQNYNIVSLGQKENKENTKFATLGYKNGSVGIFHIAGQFLVNGDLGVEGEVYPGYRQYSDGYYGSNSPIYGYMRFDLDSNKITESNITGDFKANFYIKSWKLSNNIFGSKNKLYTKQNTNTSWYDCSTVGLYTTNDSFINYNRLYNSIQAQQKKIEKGTSLKSENGKIHIKVGGIYNIEDIKDIDEIIFDNFEDNKNKLTIITIQNSGDINFPLISKDTGSYKGIPTNDYYNKKIATQGYEMDSFIQEDEYHGNIIFNVPNANYIKLAPNAPFAGHLIAPNADVETEETQLAGCMIVNSLYAEGGSEAHFYPLTSTATYEVSEYNDLTESEKTTLGTMRLKRLLGGSASTIETTVLGDETEFRKEEAKLNEILDKEQNKTSNNTIAPIIDILQNPLTKRNIIIIISALIIIGVTLCLTFKKKIKR